MLSVKHTVVLMKKIYRYRKYHKHTHRSTNIFLAIVVISFFRLQNTDVFTRVNLKYFYLLKPKVEILFELCLYLA